MTDCNQGFPDKFNFLLNEWLAGTSCRRGGISISIHWLSPCERYSLFRHGGHSEYIGRFHNIAYCPTVYSLYSINCAPDPYNRNALWRTEGRLNKRELQTVVNGLIENND